MRSLDLRDYQHTEKIQNPVTKEVKELTLPYMVKDSLLNIMFLPSLNLRGAELVRQNVLAMKVEAAGDEILLEEEEFERIKTAVESYGAKSRADVGLVDRILNQTPQLEEKT